MDISETAKQIVVIGIVMTNPLSIETIYNKYKDDLAIIHCQVIEEVKTRVGKDNQFITKATLTHLPGNAEFAQNLKEALSLKYSSLYIGADNKSLSYTITSEYAYSPSTGYPVILSEGKFNKSSDYDFIMFYLGIKLAQRHLNSFTNQYL